MSLYLKNAVGCEDCVFQRDCGGLSEKSSLFGCYSECIVSCKRATCDLTCPNNPNLFTERLVEIGGTFGSSLPALKAPTIRLPRYITKIHNGSGREKDIEMRVAAIPIRELLCKSGPNVSCRFQDASQVRQYFRLSAQTDYIISCISVDPDVEMVWNGLRYGELAKDIARLKPAAIIVPNFSFFIDDVPRTHTLYNRKRICLAAQILSEVDCRVIVPLNALTAHDWNYWYELLRGNPAMKYVAKEFQTGLSGPSAARQAIEHLSRLQERLGRSLHPVALGAGRYRTIMRTHFDKYTIIDSRPFMAATKRRLMIQAKSGSYSEVFSPTARNESTDNLLEANLRDYQKRFE